MLKITTKSGAVYYLHNNGAISGGSLGVKEGRPFYKPFVGQPLLIHTPERGHLNPDFQMPSVVSTVVVSIEEVPDAGEN